MAGLSLENLLGLKIKVTTILDTAIQGKVYAFDNATNTLTIIEDRANSGKANIGRSNSNTKLNNYRIIKTSFLKSVQVLNGGAASKNNKTGKNKREKITFRSAEPKISAVDIAQVKAKEIETARQQEKERQQSARDKFIESNLRLIGGINGKEIYKKITKLFPLEEIVVRNENIIIFDTVKISKPYEIENIEIIKDGAQVEKDKRMESSIEFVKNIIHDVNSTIAGG